ncbi:MAG: thioesterase family protein [Chloroflexi bacterium]|nr:thioesterase family protein [Chloroflexota bacterium]
MSITPGQKGELSWTVRKEHTVNRTGKPGADVLSTPSMIMLLEMAAIEAVDAKLPAGYATVGFHVDVKHFAPAPIGSAVTGRAEVTAVDGNKIAFSVVAFCGDRKIGEGTHRRAVIPTG